VSDELEIGLPELGSKSQTWLDITERIAKVTGIVAIPVVIPIALAIYSARVQDTAQKETLNRDYVQLAVSLLREKKDAVDTDIRDWAVDVLNEHSPTKMRPEVVTKLKSGTHPLPAAVSSLRVPEIIVSSPAKKVYVEATDVGVEVHRLGTREKLYALRLPSIAYDIDFSRDGSVFAVGCEDGLVLVINTDHGGIEGRVNVGSRISGVKFDDAGKLVVHTVQGDQTFDVKDLGR
jgi:hypothetical protein